MTSASLHNGLDIGYTNVSTTTSCVVTRFRTRSVIETMRMYWRYRAVRKQALESPGLLATTFLLESPRIFVTLSIWRDDRAIVDFMTTGVAHVDAANAYFRRNRVRRGPPEVWSAQFRLSAVSPYNLRWGALAARANEARGPGASARKPSEQPGESWARRMDAVR